MKKAFTITKASDVPDEMAQRIREGVERLDLVLQEQLLKHGVEVSLNSLAVSSAAFLSAIITTISDEDLPISLLDEYLKATRSAAIFYLKRAPCTLNASEEEETNRPR